MPQVLFDISFSINPINLLYILRIKIRHQFLKMFYSIRLKFIISISKAWLKIILQNRLNTLLIKIH